MRLRLKNFLACASVAFVVTLLTFVAVSCAQQTPSVDYHKQMEFFLALGQYPYDKAGGALTKADAYWLSLQKGKVLASFFPQIRFTNEGVWESDKDFYDTVAEVAFKGTGMWLTMEEKLSREGAVQLYLADPVAHLSTKLHNEGSFGGIAISIVKKEVQGNVIAALRLKMYPGDKEVFKRVVEKANTLFSEASTDKTKSAAVLMIYLGLFSENRAVWPLKSGDAQEEESQVRDAFQAITETKLDGYEQKLGLLDKEPERPPQIKEDELAEVGQNEKIYFAIWFRGTGNTRPFADYFDDNKIDKFNYPVYARIRFIFS